MKNTSHVSASIEFLSVKDAAVYLQLRVGQIKHLITQDLIDSKLENGVTVVDVNSIDKLVMVDLKKRENVYPIRKDYKLKSEKTIDKKIVINSVIDGVENSKDQYFVGYKQFFNSLRGNYANDHDVSNVQLLVHDVIHYYHNHKAPLYYDYKEYTMVSLKNKDSEYEKYFYFVPSENFLNKLKTIDFLITIQKVCSNFTDENCKNFFNEKLSEYVYENHLFYLTLDEFIKEFSPPEHYKKNKLWSMYVDQTEYEASNDEDISRSPVELHKVKSFLRRQPYGSRENPQSKMTWVKEHERGGRK